MPCFFAAAKKHDAAKMVANMRRTTALLGIVAAVAVALWLGPAVIRWANTRTIATLDLASLTLDIWSEVDLGDPYESAPVFYRIQNGDQVIVSKWYFATDPFLKTTFNFRVVSAREGKLFCVFDKAGATDQLVMLDVPSGRSWPRERGDVSYTDDGEAHRLEVEKFWRQRHAVLKEANPELPPFTW